MLNGLRVAELRYPVMALGPGRRLGLWVQGCHIGCRGCMSRSTWDPAGSAAESVAGVVADALSLVDDDLSGITISGGEPFEQASAVVAFLDGFLERWTGPGDLDVLGYTGLSESAAREVSPSLVERLDALVCGPYLENHPSDHSLMGSCNQRVVTLSDRGRERFDGYRPSGPSVQIAVSAGTVTVVGIPRRGDLGLVERSLLDAGIELGEASWRA